MFVLPRIIIGILLFHGCLTWGKMSSKAPSPVGFVTSVHPALAFWLANEYGSRALTPKLTKIQANAVALDRWVGSE